MSNTTETREVSMKELAQAFEGEIHQCFFY